MKQSVFVLLFVTGALPLSLCCPYRYYLIPEEKTWSDAQTYCKTDHTGLAIIQSNDNMVRLQDEIQTHQFSSSAWIGLYREHVDWYWSLGNEPLGNMTVWYLSEPDNWLSEEWCGFIHSNGWGDTKCTKLLTFVCFDDTKTGDERYIYVSNSMSWYGAQTYCRNHYTDLTSVRDQAEYSLVKGLTSDDIWIGLTRESWKWTGQTVSSIISWMSGKPDITGGDKTCGYLNSGQADDALCTDLMSFFCYSAITGKQQIMRMEVRSSKDADDPAVTDDIRETIDQKLKEWGMPGNIIVKWRVRPDGKVFQKKKEKKTAEND